MSKEHEEREESLIIDLDDPRYREEHQIDFSANDDEGEYVRPLDKDTEELLDHLDQSESS